MSVLARQGVDLRGRGLAFPCLVGPAAEDHARLLREGAPVVLPRGVRALVDTGASDSVLAQQVAEDLGLRATGRTWIRTAASNDPAFVQLFAIDLLLPSGEVLRELEVIGADLQSHDYDMLLGRDVLSRAVLVYTGELDAFALAF